MDRRGADIGGEGNGGVIHRDCHLGRDSAVAMTYVISYLREHPETTVSEWADSFPEYINVKRKVEYTGDFSRMAVLLEQYMGSPVAYTAAVCGGGKAVGFM
jgi:phosphomannomutase